MEIQEDSWCFVLLLAKQNQVAASLQPFASALMLWTDESLLLSSKSLSPISVLAIHLQCSFLLRWDKLKCQSLRNELFSLPHAALPEPQPSLTLPAQWWWTLCLRE